MVYEPLSFLEKIKRFNYSIMGLVLLLVLIGFCLLYSAGGGSLDPWVRSQAVKFSMGIVFMLGIAFLDVRFFLKYAYIVYGFVLLLLILVHVSGVIGMGAQRWIGIGPLRLQPSELMKVSLIVVLGCYYHRLSLEEAQQVRFSLIPLGLIILPTALVLKQPDLGTALLLVSIGVSIVFVAGMRLRYFIGAFFAFLGSLPIIWQFLHEYQKKRVLTFLNPEADPLGSGYHILQSKIALGSGGIFGKGFLHGTQSHLNFLPEKQTDFIFTMFCEEFGLIGAIGLLLVYGLLVFQCMMVSVRSRSSFGRLAGFGVAMSFFVYIFINIAMVIGLVPVVGVPLPFISYGGTSLITLLLSVGIILNIDMHQDCKIPRYS